MAEWVTVGKADDITGDEATAFDVNGQQIAVARVDGQPRAFSDICTHRQCNLSLGGEIDGSTIECECHGSVFDMTTGEVLNGPATEPIATFPVSDEGGDLKIEAGGSRAHRRPGARSPHLRPRPATPHP